jgi:two-component system NtrC family sensor kinase
MSDSRTIKIVHVDDRDDNRYIISRILRSAGYEVTEGKSGVEALQLAATLPDLMILDVKLPDMLGYEVCRRIKANPATRGIMIIQLSASFVSNESKVQSLESGADQYLTQPVDPTVLIASVRALLRLQQAELTSRTAASQWQSTFDSLSEGVALLDADYKILRCNKALTHLLDCSAEAILNRDCRKVLAEVVGLKPEQFPSFSSRQVFDIHHGRRNFRISGDPISSHHASFSGSIMVMTETTDQKRSQEALRVAEHLAATGRLAHSIAHEINNPLEAVTNLLYLLQQEIDEGTRASEYLQIAERELARVSHITKQTLSFSRDAGGSAEVSLTALTDNVLDLYRADLSMKAIEVEKRYQDTSEIAVHSGQMRQVFSNLIANAIHAVPERGKIIVHVSQSRSWRTGQRGIRVVIADNGVGISRANIPKIFQAFFTTKEQKGSGLGLWLSLGIVSAHHGEIRVRSSVGEKRHGSCFSIFLPFNHASTSKTSNQEHAIPA